MPQCVLFQTRPQKGFTAKKKIVFCSLSLGLILGAAIAAALFFTSDFISLKWICDVRGAKSLKILSLSLPFIAMSSALNGYFTARRNITTYSVIQIAEQLAKIAVTVFLLTIFISYGTEYACIAIAIGAVISELVSFLWAYLLYLFDRRKLKSKNASGQKIFRGFFRIAVPDALGSWARYTLTTIEHILIPAGLRKSGQNSSAALSVYGIVQGMALPIVLFPSSLIISLASMLIPEVAEHHARGLTQRIDYIISRVLNLTLIFSIGVMGIMFSYASELSAAIYKNADVAPFIKILSVIIPIMYTDMIIDSFLKGLDKQVDSMKYNILDAFLCVVLVYFLIPKMAIKGYIITIFASEIINFALSLRKLISITSFKMNVMESIVKPLFCVAASISVTNILISAAIFAALPIALAVTVKICLASIIYFIALSIFGAITKEDKSWILGILKN